MCYRTDAVVFEWGSLPSLLYPPHPPQDDIWQWGSSALPSPKLSFQHFPKLRWLMWEREGAATDGRELERGEGREGSDIRREWKGSGSQGTDPGQPGCLGTVSSLGSRLWMPPAQVPLLPQSDSLGLHYFPTTLFLSFYLYSRPVFESRHHNGLSRWAAILQLTSCPHFSMKHMRKRKAAPDGQDRAWYPQLCLGVLLQNINVFTDCGHQRYPLCDRDGSRHKQDRSVTLSEYRQTGTLFKPQNTNWPLSFTIMAPALLKLPFLNIRFIKIPIIEPSLYMAAQNPEKNISFHEFTPKSPGISGNPIRPFCKSNNCQTGGWGVGFGGWARNSAAGPGRVMVAPQKSQNNPFSHCRLGWRHEENAG